MGSVNIFVLSTGRCGSHTFAAACQHMTNFTAGHESRVRLLGDDRFAYPPNHIESDPYLAWFLGRLDREYGDDAFYVHLTRDAEAVAKSTATHWSWQGSFIRGYRNVLLQMTKAPRLDCARDFVDTVNSSIRAFLKDKTQWMAFEVEKAEVNFPVFWERIGAKGNIAAAIGEWDRKHNATPPAHHRFVGTTRNLAFRALRLYR